MIPCISCGVPAANTRCEDCRKPHRTEQVGSSRARGYDTAHDKLSKKARALQPFCVLCLSTDDLQLDHLPEAWRRKAAGKPIRLQDCRVLCRLCNVAAGKARPDTPDGEQIGSEGVRRATGSRVRGLRRKAQGAMNGGPS